MKRILSGWWDQVCIRQGWSAKIGKWQWVLLQTLVPAFICLPAFYWIASWPEEDGLSPYGFLLMFPIVAFFNRRRWDEDQKILKLED